jgi:hypothetical protein
MLTLSKRLLRITEASWCGSTRATAFSLLAMSRVGSSKKKKRIKKRRFCCSLGVVEREDATTVGCFSVVVSVISQFGI